MGYGGNVIAMVIDAAVEANFFHPVVAPVAWTSVLSDLVDGNIEGAIDTIRDDKPNAFAMTRFEAGKAAEQTHPGTGMAGDDGLF